MLYFFLYWVIVMSIPAVVLGSYGWAIYDLPLTNRGIRLATIGAGLFVPAYIALIIMLPTPFPSVA